MENRRLATAVKMSVRQRNYQRARGRALVKLAKAHREEYRLYFEQEKLNDHTQGKTWIDIHGNTTSSVDTHTRTDTNRSKTETTQTSNQSRASNL